MSDSGYPIPKTLHTREVIVRKSRFIAVLDRVCNRADMDALVAHCRDCYPRASHYCFAFNAGAPGSSRAIGQSDDGEPHGTAGQPMLNVLLHADIGEAGIVVIRYFGGTKLGKGGLARAYAEAANAVLADTPVRVALPMQTVSLDLSYAQAERVDAWVSSEQAVITDRQFGASVKLTLQVPEVRLSVLEDLLLQIGA
ncbi:MAG: YigZ family protein [Natronospirillum sp.]|uniref:IMPACT family protein n=1 Tax=Natronospirillum sp. TaxID=2812955 RepID=UPI0025E72CEF|nr:YigZ family protein [Natronospirillum sp.]MCH8551926.1 YigZ family protein [Natronospirillum sp.]